MIRCDSPNRSSRKGRAIDMIVVHSTAGLMPGCLTWMCSHEAEASCHYLISKEGKIYHLVPDDMKAWHAGRSTWQDKDNCNLYSLGIELENLNDGKDPYPQKQMFALANLIHDLVLLYGIRKTRVVGHYQIAPGRKTDPVKFDWDKLWELAREDILWPLQKLSQSKDLPRELKPQSFGARLLPLLLRLSRLLLGFFRLSGQQ